MPLHPIHPKQLVSLHHDGDVWRAEIGDHAANALDPFEALILVAHRARESGYRFALEDDDPAPTVAPVDDLLQKPTNETADQ